MECPFCYYQDMLYGRDEETDNYIREEGEHGRFFTPPENTMQLERRMEGATLFGCPACKKVFIDF